MNIAIFTDSGKLNYNAYSCWFYWYFCNALVSKALFLMKIYEEDQR